MESNIPQEIKDKIEVEAMKHGISVDWGRMKVDQVKKSSFTEGCLTGYSLALPEIATLKTEVERLKGMLEIEYKSSFSDTHFTSEEIDKFWQEYKTLNNL